MALFDLRSCQMFRLEPCFLVLVRVQGVPANPRQALPMAWMMTSMGFPGMISLMGTPILNTLLQLPGPN